ncbi:uncharacterized protein [Asterias amurensis]|uniref:uncharacterized protein n=1 Tax=Asterias amurensis TaxID=7602 RepID=UPI003AB54449
MMSSDSEEDEEERNEKMSKSEDTTPPTSTCSISKLVKVASTSKTQLTSSGSHQTTADIVLLPNKSLQQTTSTMVASTLLSPTKMCLTGLPSLPITPSPIPTAPMIPRGAAVAQALAAIGGFSFAGLPGGMLPLRTSGPVSNTPVAYPAFAMALQSGWAYRAMKSHSK